MKRYRLLTLLATLWLAGNDVSASTLYYSPDIPTDPGTGTFQQPWEVWSYAAAVYGTTPDFAVPGLPQVNALHKLDRAGSWLVSLAAPSTLAGVLTTPAEPRDVLRHDAARGFSVFFCGASVSPPLPPAANIDSLYVEAATGGDFGDLIIGFDVPVELPPGSGTVHSRSDLVRYTRTAPDCGGWSFAGRDFDAASAGVPAGTDLIGAARRGPLRLFVVDVPTVLIPSLGSAIFNRGEIVSWNGTVFDHFDALAGWPLSSRVEALSCQGNPGSVQAAAGGLQVSRAPAPGALTLQWPASCSGGAADYAVYEGTLGSFTTHLPRVCSTGGATTWTLPPSSGDTYYLVVPMNDFAEGSLGRDSSGVERPWPGPAVACQIVQALTPCP